jgi:hypothetical protein
MWWHTSAIPEIGRLKHENRMWVLVQPVWHRKTPLKKQKQNKTKEKKKSKENRNWFKETYLKTAKYTSDCK